MNVASWEVLKEVRFDLLITEPDVGRSGVRWKRRRRCPRTKRVLGRSRLTLRCHYTTNVRGEKERKRGRQSEEYQTTDISKYIDAWKCKNMWHANLNASWAHPMQTSQHTAEQQSKHTSKCMKHCYNASVMQCMRLQTHLSNTHPKNCTKPSSILKNPKIFKQPKT